MKVNFGFFISKFLRIINRPALRNCKIDKTSKVGTGSNCIDVVMKKYSYMGKNNSLCNVEIGAFCSIASYCAIGGGKHKLDAISTSPVFSEGRNILGINFGNVKEEQSKKIIIGNDVWIGEGVFICDGITIGNGAVIGAHSVITHDVPDYSIVAGAPAKIIRYRFSKDEIKELNEIKWWEWTDEKLKKEGSKFSSLSLFKGE